MPASNSLKGLRNLKTLHTKKKENQSNFLKLYILDKERMRLRNEQIRLNLRLEIINDRLKEIEAFSKSVMETEELPDKKETKTEEMHEKEGQQFNTVSFEY
jgi:transposase